MFAYLATACGQSAGNLAFDVASLKPSPPFQGISGISISGGPGTRDPGQFTYRGARLRDLIFRAYGLIDAQQQVSGPAWIDTDRFDLVAKLPAGSTTEQFQTMLQNLLTDRFKLAIHHEKKVLQVYELVVGKGGSKLKESGDAASREPGPAAGAKQDRNGFPVVPAGFSGQAMRSETGPDGHVRQNWVFRQESLDNLAGFVKTMTQRLTVDKTGLAGKYDFNLSYDVSSSSAEPGVAADPGLGIVGAVEQQLGLRLVDAKDPFDVIVIDSADRTPGGN